MAIPIKYNLRNLVARKVSTGMTAFGFTCEMPTTTGATAPCSRIAALELARRSASVTTVTGRAGAIVSVSRVESPITAAVAARTTTATGQIGMWTVPLPRVAPWALMAPPSSLIPSGSDR